MQQRSRTATRIAAAGMAAVLMAACVKPQVVRVVQTVEVEVVHTTEAPMPTRADTPTAMPSPSATSTATARPTLDLGACEIDVAFVEDVTIPDGTEMVPGKRFTKVWRIRNTGTCPWSELIKLSQIGGEDLGLLQSIPLPDAAPGEEAMVSVQMVAPETLGDHRSEWRACYLGECFGTTLFTVIRVVYPTPSPSPSPTISARGVLQSYIDLINETGMGEYVSEVGYDGDTKRVKITVRNAWHYEPEQVRLQAAQALWEAWAAGFCPDEDPDLCRIRLYDLMGNDLGGSSWLAGSIIKLDD
ncbi:MAG: NBR1-Ig-like domain-containing protein [Anaerolineae bacterium]|jgi:hypothetical protein